MKNENLYKLIFKMALSYRLSLDNVCIFLGKEVNETNKKEIYDICMELFVNEKELIKAYEFLFNLETINEPEKISNRSLALATLFYNRYKEALATKDREKIKKVIGLLNELDKNYLKLSNREIDSTLTDEEVLIISKYRLKYAIPRKKVSELLDVKLRTLIDKESQIEDEYLSYKLNLLSEYHFDLINNEKRHGR